MYSIPVDRDKNLGSQIEQAIQILKLQLITEIANAKFVNEKN